LKWLVFPLASVQGIAIAILLNTTTSLISDVVGKDSESAAFVYGFYSLLDKFSNGFLLYVLVAEYSKEEAALKTIMVLVPIVSASGALIFTWLGITLYADQLAKKPVQQPKI
jgi:hypothetical protein